MLDQQQGFALGALEDAVAKALLQRQDLGVGHAA
jgi:hypothetical protein